MAVRPWYMPDPTLSNLYHHMVSGWSKISSVCQYDYDSHIEAWLLSRVKVVGPNYYYECDMNYQATIGDYDLDCKCGYGYTPDEATTELMSQMGF